MGTLGLTFVLTWAAVSVGSYLYIRWDSKDFFSEEEYRLFAQARRYLRWSSGSKIKPLGGWISLFFTMPLGIFGYVTERDKCREDSRCEAKQAVKLAKQEMLAKYQSGKKWLHPGDRRLWEYMYQHWFQNSAFGAELMKTQRRIRFGMAGKAISSIRKNVPCSCHSPIRLKRAAEKDFCSCGGILPKDAPLLLFENLNG